MGKINTGNGVFRFRQEILYPGIQTINKEQSFKNLKSLKTILDSRSIHWGLAFGSLLGAVREHDFIDWDEDIDIYVLAEEEDLFKDSLWDLRDAGFELIRYERRGLYSIRRNGEYIDIYVLVKIDDELRYTRGSEYIFEKYLKDQQWIDFKGIQVNIPREYDEYLSLEYGDWRKPVRFFNPEMSRIKKLFAICYYYIRLCLPDFIYFPLLRYSHLKDFEKFKIKCSRRGIFLPENLTLPKNY